MNLRYHFYKSYYQGFDPRAFSSKEISEDIANKNKELFEEKNKLLQSSIPQEYLDILKVESEKFGVNLFQFRLKTIYPGLLSGSGYTHETGNVGEMKLGFHFDYTSGLPFLPGHTLKGTIRSVFPQVKSKESNSIKQTKADYIFSILGIDNSMSYNEKLEWLRAFELSIFDAAASEENQNIRKDVFLGANISKAASGGVILGLDAITPHGDKKWKNPVPLSFLKVMPGVEWEFSFLLHQAEIQGISILPAQKRNFFKQILLDIGIGAKTNVGYGQFVESNRN